MQNLMYRSSMKRLLTILLIMPLLASCGAGGGGGGTGSGGVEGDTSNQTIDGLTSRTADSPCSETYSVAKIKIDSEGIYRIGYADLWNTCIDLYKVNPDLLRLESQGVEVPIKVVDNNANGLFDDGDYIEFYGLSIPREDGRFRYTETNVYWLSNGVDKGKRILVESSSSEATPVYFSFPETLHMEKDVWYVQENYPELSSRNEIREHWFWSSPFYPSDKAGYEFTVKDVDREASVTLKVRLQSRLMGSNHVRLYMNNSAVVADEVWEGEYSPLLISVPVPHTYLNEGKNILYIEAVEGVFYLDWFEVDYNRLYLTEGNILQFTGKGEIEISGFTSPDISVYDISDPYDAKEIIPASVTGETSSGFRAILKLPQDSDKTVIALTDSKKKSPVRILPYRPVDIKSREADYIIITHEDFIDSLKPLVDYRSREGYTVATVLIGDIYDEFSYGIETPDAIKKFLQYAYNNWDNIKPEYVLLVGDTTIDFKDVSGYGENYGVKNYVPTYLYNYPGLGEVPSDNWFVDINDDTIPEMNIGRIPAKTPEGVVSVISKIIAHESFASLQSTEVLLIADRNFENLSDSIGSMISGYSVNKLYREDYPIDEEFRRDILKEINQGPLIINFTGHGSVVDWTNDDVFSSDDIQDLQNMNYPFVVTLNCLNGYFILADDGAWSNGKVQPSSIAESFLLASDRGAVAVFAPGAIGFPSEHGRLAEALYNFILSDNITLGTAVTKAKTQIYNEGLHEDVIQTFILFGDPATKLK